jgi:hypothetical protein
MIRPTHLGIYRQAARRQVQKGNWGYFPKKPNSFILGALGVLAVEYFSADR